MNILPQIYKVAAHTNNVGPGSTFVAINGSRSNGVTYITQALDKGASEIVVELSTQLPDEIIERCESTGVSITFCANARLALAHLSALAYNFPARKLKLIGITGTKGKTTSAYLLYHCLRIAGKTAALLSGVQNKINDCAFEAELTTAQPDYLNMFFDQCVQEGIEYVVMESAAQAFSLHRLAGLEYDAALFTNFSMEHAEFYLNIEDYFDAKKQIFSHIKATASVCLNVDDNWLQPLHTEQPRSVSYSLIDPQAFCFGSVRSADMAGVHMDVLVDGKQQTVYSQALAGRYNAYNTLGVICTAYKLGLTLEQIATGLESFAGAPGRLERYVTRNGVTCIVDHAHNPSSYEAVLSMLALNTKQLIVVFGCGGDRAQDKRPVMGAIASAYAHTVVLTSDNPRSEEVADIITQIMSGISDVDKVIIEMDRATAIAKAIALAEPGAVVAVLGKGQDEYELVAGVKSFFSDRIEVQKHL